MPRGAVALWTLLFASTAQAQVSGNVAVVSDYRFRGVSLSDDRPALQLGIAYDHPDGWYAGAFASSVRPAPQVGGDAQLLAYLGHAWRLRNGLSWEAGVEYAMLVGASDYDYPELYVGLASEHLGARFYFARHFGGVPVVYAELNGTHALSERTRLLAHLGWLRRGAGETALPLERERFDLRAGIGLALSGFDLQLAWVLSEGHGGRFPIYPSARPADRSGWVLSLSRAW
ncbi:TorF family putative porin [Lysobacter cavernae]|uniref:TorF family putative porin n=1 Tax=Lysobacter cavernae TaxID=1685901 RepID=A0ABV7RN64_9GAMM